MRFAYVYAVALHDSRQPVEAIAVLEKAHRQRPANREVLVALVTFLRGRGQVAEAAQYEARLAAWASGTPEKA